MADMFKRLFGGGGAPSSSTSSSGGVSKNAQSKTFDALQNLQAQEEQMEKRKEVLEAKVKIEEEKVKQYLKENKKSQAMMVLKKKKLLEKQIEGLDVNMTRIMEQRAQLESNQATIASVAALKQATAAQKATMAEMNIDNVVDTLEQIQDANDQMNEINQALANPIGMGTDLDEDDLAAELDAMNNDMMLEGAQKMEGDLLAAGAVPITTVPTPAQQEALPSAPSKPAAVKKTPEELELEAIQKEMGLLEAA